MQGRIMTQLSGWPAIVTRLSVVSSCSQVEAGGNTESAKAPCTLLSYGSNVPRTKRCGGGR